MMDYYGLPDRFSTPLRTSTVQSEIHPSPGWWWGGEWARPWVTSSTSAPPWTRPPGATRPATLSTSTFTRSWSVQSRAHKISSQSYFLSNSKCIALLAISLCVDLFAWYLDIYILSGSELGDWETHHWPPSSRLWSSLRPGNLILRLQILPSPGSRLSERHHLLVELRPLRVDKNIIQLEEF